MKISVVTVCFNGEATLYDAIQSVAGQDHQEHEHIVVDGASTDGTRDILSRNRHLLASVVSEPDRGIYDAMNKGVALSQGDVVGFLNADDVYAHPGVLSRIAEEFADKSIDACYADLVYVDTNDPGKVVRYWKSRPYVPGLFEGGWMPAHPTFYVRRSVYERFGAYDLRYRFAADFELTMRLMAVRRIKAVYVPETWVRMRAGGATNRNKLRTNLEAYRAARRNGLQVTPFFVLRKIASRLPQFFWLPR